MPNGEKGFIVREDGDWEGNNGQVISAINVARSNMDRTTSNEVQRTQIQKLKGNK